MGTARDNFMRSLPLFLLAPFFAIWKQGDAGVVSGFLEHCLDTEWLAFMLDDALAYGLFWFEVLNVHKCAS